MVEEQNNRPKRSSGGMVRCDAMRCEGSKMKCGRVDEGCFDFGKRADVMSE